MTFWFIFVALGFMCLLHIIVNWEDIYRWFFLPRRKADYESASTGCEYWFHEQIAYEYTSGWEGDVRRSKIMFEVRSDGNLYYCSKELRLMNADIMPKSVQAAYQQYLVEEVLLGQ